MKKLILMAIVALSALALTFSSCTKEKVGPVAPPTTTKLLISKNVQYDVSMSIGISSRYYYNAVLTQQIGFINLRSEGKDVTLNELPVSINVGSNYIGANKLVGLVHLFDLDGDEVDYEDLTVSSDGSGTVTFVNLDFNIQAQTTSFILKIDILTPQYTYQNTMIQAAVTGNNANAIVAYETEDKNNVLANTPGQKQIVSTYQGSFISILWQ